MAGIYVHIPFCNKACHYCDFHFTVSLKQKPEIVGAIQSELQFFSNTINEEISSIYFGGGTPSLLSEVELKSILSSIQKNYDVSNDAEITLEANPDDISIEKLEIWKHSGVNRLSIGIQAFQDDVLLWMNRSHDSLQASKCVELAKECGFNNISIDLIYGVPMMTDEQWRENVQQAVNLKVQHISAYNLTVEAGTHLGLKVKKGEEPDVNDEQGARNLKVLQEILFNNGFEQYEISNFCKPNFESQHNSSYWKMKKYIGVGPSAHSFDGKSRWWNVSSNAGYLKLVQERNFQNEIEELTSQDLFNEHLMIGLRNKWGCSLSYLQSQLDPRDWNEWLERIKGYQNDSLLKIIEGQLLTTSAGLMLADRIASELFISS